MVLQLRPLAPAKAASLATEILNFFSLNGPPLYEEKRRILGLPELPANTVEPFTLANFHAWYHRTHGEALLPQMQQVGEILRGLEAAGYLTALGETGAGWFGEGRRYHTTLHLSTRARQGALWLGRALGASHIADRIRFSLARITGVTPEKDAAVGTGCHVLPGVVLTCAHVVEDMKVDPQLWIADIPHEIASVQTDTANDLAVIFLRDNPKLINPDICFREGALLEPLLIAGYPTIPLNTEPLVTYQKGEVCGFMTAPMFGPKSVIFSAIARPGNSGGPIVGMDGQIIGIVTRQLEREREKADALSPFPFFSAISAGVVKEKWPELTGGQAFPWEDYAYY